MDSPIQIFKTIAKIPKCSSNASKMMDYIVGYASELGYDVLIDNAANVLCKIGEKQKICLQAHYDMVCMGDVANISLMEENGFLKAKNSTLGADNCIGVAYMLLLMKDYKNIEYLFTADEEIGLIGAKNINLPIASKYLINTDTECEYDIGIGCAGGYLIEADFFVSFNELSSDSNIYRLKTKKFPGGHSGFDAHKGIKNAIKETAYFLKSLSEAKIISFCGGEKINSIPKDVEAVFAVNREISDYASDMFLIEKIEKIDNAKYFAIAESDKIIDILVSLPSGILGFNDEFLTVSDSVNLAIVTQEADRLRFTIMGRANSNLLIAKNLLSIQTIMKLFDFCNIKILDTYPAWEADKNDLALIVKEIFSDVLGKADFRVVHAGFECGVLREKYPHLQVVSVGPNIYNPHSLSERVDIKSTQRVYIAIKKVIDTILSRQSHI